MHQGYSLVSIHWQVVRVFILQPCLKTPPINYRRIYITTRHTQTHTPSLIQTHTLLNTHSQIHTHQQKQMWRRCLPQTQSQTQTHSWKYTQTCSHTLLHTHKQKLAHARTHTLPSWYSCIRCLRCRPPTQRGMKEQLEKKWVCWKM